MSVNSTYGGLQAVQPLEKVCVDKILSGYVPLKLRKSAAGLRGRSLSGAYRARDLYSPLQGWLHPQPRGSP
jgi:hypothetical protein